MKKVCLFSVFMLSFGFVSAKSSFAESVVVNKNVNFKEMNTYSSSNLKVNKTKISNADDDSLFCEGVGWAAEKAARRLGASRSLAKKLRFAAEMACEAGFD